LFPAKGTPARLKHTEYDGGEKHEGHNRGGDVQPKSELHLNLLLLTFTSLHQRLPRHQTAPHEQTVRFVKDAWQAEKFPQREKKTFVLKCIYVTVCAESAT